MDMKKTVVRTIFIVGMMLIASSCNDLKESLEWAKFDQTEDILLYKEFVAKYPNSSQFKDEETIERASDIYQGIIDTCSQFHDMYYYIALAHADPTMREKYSFLKANYKEYEKGRWRLYYDGRGSDEDLKHWMSRYKKEKRKSYGKPDFPEEQFYNVAQKKFNSRVKDLQ